MLDNLTIPELSKARTPPALIAATSTEEKADISETI